MAVSIRPRFNPNEVAAIMQQRLQAIEAAILSRLQRVGETFVKNARDNNTYKDQTGNLRSSIGYVILKDGVQLNENFKAYPNKEGKGKSRKTKAGVNQAKSIISEAVRNFPRGYVLIVVAGMDYAAAVESKGKDVLTASSITAKNDLYKAILAIQNKIGKMR